MIVMTLPLPRYKGKLIIWMEDIRSTLADIKLSFQLMHKKVRSIIEAGNPTGIDMKLLTAYDTNLENRVGQVDRGVFKWGCIVGKKPN